MIRNNFCNLLGWLAIAGSAAGASTALADGRRHCCKPEVDVDCRDAKLVEHDGQWIVKVHYNVDVEDACDNDRFVLTVHLREDDCRILDADGRAFGVTVALDARAHCDEDELKFKGGF